ncbi:hypothetical protein C2S52_017797 [Perilla frutescens var. hirtella]|uniref:Uncharacterized protein n=1 Tax=Perilla frutescens var. hirtella TaxID=608512 RepID=A0AAD4ILU6_PERFH|nr:hypothetical protein C2S53_019036 [Perilla frutescens var. hirtella]KAH6766814.1 hypothetical protein C2S52_017797 [Perilla frutescens var. hirtella]KAH6811558.1 hypothetical protein C2S51_025320 [Perilla frutescens var. frutescens]
MAKFNVVQKRRRAALATQKRQLHGDPTTGKLHQKIQPQSISGKRQRKLLKKWRREQKEAVEKGLITMQDVEMAVADEPAKDANKSSVKFPMKKSSRLRVKQLKKKGKSQKKSQNPVGEASNDSMME